VILLDELQLKGQSAKYENVDHLYLLPVEAVPPHTPTEVIGKGAVSAF
jgi:hypothetical protein